jgi:hypothetical protein
MKAFLEVLLTVFEDRRQPIIDLLNNIHLTDDEESVARMAAKARSYTIAGGQLYKKGVVHPLLRCISQEEGKALLVEIHFDVCDSHIGPRALSSKAIRQGFYWPTHVRELSKLPRRVKPVKTFHLTKQNFRQKYN